LKASTGGYNWARKIALQLQEHEVVELLGVLRGGRENATFGHHGTARDKTLRIDAQAGKGGFYVNLRQGSDSRGVPVPQMHSFGIVALAVVVLRAAYPQFSSDEILAMADGVARRFAVPATTA
jgi:hypothetical protein